MSIFQIENLLRTVPENAEGFDEYGKVGHRHKKCFLQGS